MRIGILSRSPELYSTQSLYRAGMSRGHIMEIINSNQCNLVIEHDHAEVYYNDRPLSNLDAVIPRIGTSFTPEGAALVTQFQLMKIFSTLNPEGLLLVRDKLRCLQKLRLAGIEVPATAFVAEGQQAGNFIDQVGGLPVVIKMVESTHGIGVVLAESYRSAESTVEAFLKLKERVIVQEFIAEAGGADIRAFVVNGRVVASMKRQAKEGEFRSNLHRGATAQSEPLTELETYVACKTAQIVGLDIAGVDILRSDRGPLVMEVNASPGLEGIESYTGVDVASKIISFVERKVLAKNKKKLKVIV